MRIIRLQVECRQDEGYSTRKYAVGLDTKHHRKVGSFVKYIKKLCMLRDHEYHLELNGFQISDRDLTKALKDYHIYDLRLSLSPKLKSRNNDEYQIVSESKSSKVEKKILRKGRIHQKKQSVSSISSQSRSSSPQQQQQQQRWSSSESSQSQVQLKKKVPLVQKQKLNSPPKQQILDNKNPKPKVNSIVNNKQNNNKKKSVSLNKQSSSDSESSSSLVLINKAPNKPQPLKTINQKQVLPQPNKIIATPKETVKPKQLQKQVVMSDSSESEPSQSQSQPKKTTIKVDKPNSQVQLKGGQSNKSRQVISKPEMKIPPALRNKIIPKKSLQDHKQNQWLTITKQLAAKWLQTGEKYICQPNNQIRFKIIELDEQRFVPVTSGWIKGNVKSVDSSNGSVSLTKVDEQRKPYRQYYQICEHNMNQLQINRLLATPQQLACFVSSNQPTNVIENKIVQGQQPKIDNQQAKQEKNSVEKYVCGQVNYYFSDKSYNTDLFTQMHALRHPQRYLNLKFLLNFPKIKKVLRDEEKLYSYLKDDDKYSQRNYEIDFQNKLIRKKGLKIEKQVQNVGEEHNGEEGRNEFVE